MTPEQPDASAVDVPAQGYAMLDAAAGQLREHVDVRWVEVSGRVLATALRASRRAMPVRAHTSSGPVMVSEQVLVAYLREALDGAVPGSAVAAISVTIEDRDRFGGVLVELVTQYRRPILPLADDVREIAAGVLRELLGLDTPDVDVRATHVHVGDVTVGDPQITEP